MLDIIKEVGISGKGVWGVIKVILITALSCISYFMILFLEVPKVPNQHFLLLPHHCLG